MATSSLLPASRSRVVDDCQACQVLMSSSYWQDCRRKEFVVQQQKRPLFQQHSDNGDWELVYKHSRRYYFISMYCLLNVTMALILINAAIFMRGDSVTDSVIADDIFGEQSRHIFMNVTMLVCPLLYLLTHTLMSRTILYIYYNQSKRHFRAICYSWRKARRNIMFKPGEVQLVPETAGALQMLRGRYIIDKKSYHISPMDFSSTRYYNLMLGFINP